MKRWGWIAAGTLYLAVALWQTRAIWGQWTTHYLGAGELEGWLWRYWWMKRMMAAAWSESSLAYAAYVAAVAGSYPETGNVFDLQVLSWPLEALLGAPLYYNVKVILVLLLDGLAGFALGRYLFRDWAAAAVCGLVVGASPYLLHEIGNGRVRQAIVFPLPLYALFLVRTWRQPGLREAALAGLFAGLASAVYLYYGMAAVFFTVIYVGWMALTRVEGPLDRRRLLYGAVVLAVALAVTMPFAWSYVDRQLRGQDLPEVTWLRTFPSLAELTSPNPETVLKQNDPLLNSLQRFRADSMPWEHAFMPRYSRSLPWIFSLMALLAVPTAWLAWRRQAPPDPGLATAALLPWLLAGLFFYLLVLGPYLKTGPANDYVSPGVATPYGLMFKYVPAFSRLFSPVRMTSMLLVCMGVLAGAFLLTLFRRFSAPPPVRVAAALAVTLLAADGMRLAGQVPVQVSRVEVPAYYRRLAAEPFCTIVELPFRTGDFIQNYQSVHGQKLLLGWSDGGLPPGFPQGDITRLARTFEGLPENTFLRWLENLTVRPEDPGSYRPEDLRFMVEEVGVKYVIVHERGSHLVSPGRGREHYLAVLRALEARFGPPVDGSKELAWERMGPAPDPSAKGPFEYDMAVFRVQ